MNGVTNQLRGRRARSKLLDSRGLGRFTDLQKSKLTDRGFSAFVSNLCAAREFATAEATMPTFGRTLMGLRPYIVLGFMVLAIFCLSGAMNADWFPPANLVGKWAGETRIVVAWTSSAGCRFQSRLPQMGL
jgi:hypothetical protein